MVDCMSVHCYFFGTHFPCLHLNGCFGSLFVVSYVPLIVFLFNGIPAKHCYLIPPYVMPLGLYRYNKWNERDLLLSSSLCQVKPVVHHHLCSYLCKQLVLNRKLAEWSTISLLVDCNLVVIFSRLTMPCKVAAILWVVYIVPPSYITDPRLKEAFCPSLTEQPEVNCHWDRCPALYWCALPQGFSFRFRPNHDRFNCSPPLCVGGAGLACCFPVNRLFSQAPFQILPHFSEQG